MYIIQRTFDVQNPRTCTLIFLKINQSISMTKIVMTSLRDYSSQEIDNISDQIIDRKAISEQF